MAVELMLLLLKKNFSLTANRAGPIAVMNFRYLEYLVASAAAGTFSRAARSLGISTSTISRCIGRFEDELGLAVFERGHQGIRLTAAGEVALRHARRAVMELEAVKAAGARNGLGAAGEVRLGVRMPPIGDQLCDLLIGWRQRCPDVLLTVSEMSERDLVIALNERRLDVALAPGRALPARLPTLPVCRERLFAALPRGHKLARRQALDWPLLGLETILVQGWEESQAERDFLGSLLGGGGHFLSHAASRQSLLALVAAGLGMAIVTASQMEAGFPGVAFKPIGEPDAFLQLDLAWLPEAEDPALGRFIAVMRDAVRSAGFF